MNDDETNDDTSLLPLGCWTHGPQWPNRVPLIRQPIPAHVSALELQLHSEMTSCDAGAIHQLDRLTSKLGDLTNENGAEYQTNRYQQNWSI